MSQRTVSVRGKRFPVIRDYRLGGKVYQAIEKLSGQRPRYKVYDKHAGPDGDFRVLQIVPNSPRVREYVKVLQRVSRHNSNFPGIIDYHVTAEDVMLVVNWIPGQTLAHHLKNSKTKKGLGISVFEAIRLYHGFAHGLTQLSHRKNIVHGDLKPENLLICREPNRLVAIDFGSAWTVEQSVKREEGDGLSGAYAAPELLSGDRSVDFRSDQFSATVIYYEMLTLERPYDGIGGRAALPQFKSWRDKFIPPSKKSPYARYLNRSVWREVDHVVQTGLKLDYRERFQNRREWLDALEVIKFEISRTSRLCDENLFIVRAMRWINQLFPERKQSR